VRAFSLFLLLLTFPCFDNYICRLCKLRSDELQDSLNLCRKVEPGSATNRLTEEFATVIGRVSARLNRRADAIARSMRRARSNSAKKSPASPSFGPSRTPLDHGNVLYSPFFDSASPAVDSSLE
jgi:hypothetical protein